MTTGRINQVASRQGEGSNRSDSNPESGYASAREGGSAGPAPRRDPRSLNQLKRHRIFAFGSGSALTTSPTASSLRGMRSKTSREICVGRKGRKTPYLTSVLSGETTAPRPSHRQKRREESGLRRAEGRRRRAVESIVVPERHAGAHLARDERATRTLTTRLTDTTCSTYKAKVCEQVAKFSHWVRARRHSRRRDESADGAKNRNNYELK